MDDQTLKRLQALENPIQTSDFPEIKNNADLAMFLKRSVNDGVLYTNIQRENIVSFVGDDYSRLHQNASFELLYVLDGTIVKTIENKEYTLQTGQGYILNRRIVHSEHLKNGFLLCLNFTEDFFNEITKEEKIDFSRHPVFNFIKNSNQKDAGWKKSYLEFSPRLPIQNKIFNIILDSLQQELATSKIGTSFFQKGLFLRLLEQLENHHMFELNPIDVTSSKEEFLIDRLTSFIGQHYGDVSRKQIEENLHYNDEYLNRLLKKACGKTINAYATEIRIDRAKELLISTDLTVSKITELLNFSSDNYFYHFFKKATKLSPNQYRQAHKK